MKFLVYGTNGWIGRKVYNQLLKDGTNVVEGKSRVDNVKELEEEIKAVQPTHVVSLIGRTHGSINGKYYGTIDYLEEKGKVFENVRDNLFSPMILSNMARKYNFLFAYLGTGCIFDFDETHPFGQEVNGFTEDSLPNYFGSSYSIVKGFTDQLMHLYNDCTLNLRIRMPITDEYNGRNFITKITNYEKICSIPNSMTNLDELIPLMIDMIKNNITGTVNLTNPGLITHNEILKMYKELVDPQFTWNNFNLEEQAKILSCGRSNNYLDTTRLETLYPHVKNIKDSVKDVLIRMAERNNKN